MPDIDLLNLPCPIASLTDDYLRGEQPLPTNEKNALRVILEGFISFQEIEDFKNKDLLDASDVFCPSDFYLNSSDFIELVIALADITPYEARKLVMAMTKEVIA